MQQGYRLPWRPYTARVCTLRGRRKIRKWQCFCAGRSVWPGGWLPASHGPFAPAVSPARCAPEMGGCSAPWRCSVLPRASSKACQQLAKPAASPPVEEPTPAIVGRPRATSGALNIPGHRAAATPTQLHDERRSPDAGGCAPTARRTVEPQSAPKPSPSASCDCLWRCRQSHALPSLRRLCSPAPMFRPSARVSLLATQRAWGQLDTSRPRGRRRVPTAAHAGSTGTVGMTGAPHHVAVGAAPSFQ